MGCNGLQAAGAGRDGDAAIDAGRRTSRHTAPCRHAAAANDITLCRFVQQSAVIVIKRRRTCSWLHAARSPFPLNALQWTHKLNTAHGEILPYEGKSRFLWVRHFPAMLANVAITKQRFRFKQFQS